jgi:hypothetical protein
MWNLILTLFGCGQRRKVIKRLKPKIKRERLSVPYLRAEHHNQIRWDAFRRKMCSDPFNCICGHCFHSCQEQGCDMSWKNI